MSDFLSLETIIISGLLIIVGHITVFDCEIRESFEATRWLIFKV